MAIEHVLRVKDLGSDVISEFKAEVQDALGATDGLTAGLANMGAGVAGAVGAYVGLTKEIADFKNEIVDSATRTGLAVETLAGLDLAARGSGQSVGTLTGALKPFTKGILDASRGTGEALIGFQALDVETTNLDGTLRSADSVLREVTAKLAAIEDPTTKAALATQVFGEAGGDLMVALGDTALDEFIADAERLGPSFEDGAAGAADMQRAIAELELATLGASDAFAQAFGGEDGLAGLIRDISDEIVILGSVLGQFFSGVSSDAQALFGAYSGAFDELRAGNIGGGLLDLGAAMGQGLVTVFDPTRAVDTVQSVTDARRQQEGDAFLALSLEAANAVSGELGQVELDLTTLTEESAEKRTAARKAEAREAEKIAQDMAKHAAEWRSYLIASSAAGPSTMDLQSAALAASLDAGASQATAQATAQIALAQATMRANASLDSARSLSDPFSTFGRGLQDASSLEASLAAQFGQGLGGINPAGDIAQAGNLVRFNAGLELASSVLGNFAGVAQAAGASLSSLVLGDALGAGQAGLAALGGFAGGQVRTGTQIAGAALAAANPVVGGAVQVIGDKVAGRIESLFGGLGQGLGLVTSLGQIGASGVDKNLRDFQRDFFAGLEVLPQVITEVLPPFIEEFTEAFVDVFPEFSVAMTDALIEAGPDIGAAIATGMVDLAKAQAGLSRQAAFNLSNQAGIFASNLGDSVGDRIRTGLGGNQIQRTRVIRIDGPEFLRGLVEQLNSELGDRGGRLSLAGQ